MCITVSALLLILSLTGILESVSAIQLLRLLSSSTKWDNKPICPVKLLSTHDPPLLLQSMIAMTIYSQKCDTDKISSISNVRKHNVKEVI